MSQMGSLGSRKNITHSFNNIKLNSMESLQDDSKPNSLLKNIFVEYTGVSPIHGFHHFGEEKKFRLEILVWIIIFIVAFVGCSIMIFSLWNKWDDNPLIVTFDNNLMNIDEIPFPAVTICSSAKAHKAHVNIFDNFLNLKNNNILSKEQ